MNASTIKAIRKEVARTKAIEEGTVVKFDRDMTVSGQAVLRNVPNFPETITYAAIFVGGRWYLTGKGRLGNEALTTRDFFDRLAEPDVSNVQVATGFEAV